MRLPWKRTPPTATPEPEVSDAVTETVRKGEQQSRYIQALRRETSCLARDAEQIRDQNHFGQAMMQAMGAT